MAGFVGGGAGRRPDHDGVGTVGPGGRPQGSALCISGRRDRLRPGAIERSLFTHRHRRHFRGAARVRLSGPAVCHEAADRGGHAGDLGRFHEFHVPNPARHPLCRRPGVQGPGWSPNPARTDRAGLRVFDQAPLRPDLEEPQPVPAGKRPSARADRAAQEGDRGEDAIPLRHRSRRHPGTRPLHLPGATGRTVAALSPATDDRQLGVRRGGTRSGGVLWRQDHGAPGGNGCVPIGRMAAQLAHRARAQPGLSRSALRRTTQRG